MKNIAFTQYNIFSLRVIEVKLHFLLLFIVMFHKLWRCKSLFTMTTNKNWLFLVSLKMFIQIALLSETLATAFNWADKWSFICMNPHMVKQIMPFPKGFAAIFMVTEENLRPATCLHIVIFYISEELWRWQANLLPKTRQVYFLSVLTSYWGIYQ